MGKKYRKKIIIKNIFIFIIILLIPILIIGVLRVTKMKSLKENNVEKEYYILIKGYKINVELAYTEEKKIKGLMYREFLPFNQGMLFIYNTPQFLSFWMKNTLIPLSIAFIDKNKIITDIYKMKSYNGEPAFSLTSYKSSKPVQYALEVNQGWFEKYNIKKGTKVEFSKDLEKFINNLLNKNKQF